MIDVNELEAIWERLRIMNRSLEEDLRQNEADYHSIGNSYNHEELYLEHLTISSKKEQVEEIMAIIEGMVVVGRKIKITKLAGYDFCFGIKVGDVYSVHELLEDGDAIIITPKGNKRVIFESQFVFVSDK